MSIYRQYHDQAPDVALPLQVLSYAILIIGASLYLLRSETAKPADSAPVPA